MGCLKSIWDSRLARILRLVVLPLGLYLFDVTTDLALAVQYYYSGDYTWFGLTLGFVLVPSIFVNIFLWITARNEQDSKLIRSLKILLAFLQLGAFPAYVNILYLLMRGKDVKERVEEHLPIAHLLEATFESVPQLCLQLYIIVSTGEQVSVLKVITMVISLLAAVKAVVTFRYSKFEKAEWMKNATFNCKFGAFVSLFTTWKVIELSTRILDVGLFASAFKPWIVLPFGIHWLIMTGTYIWIDEEFRTCSGVIAASLMMAVDTFSMTHSLAHKRTFWVNTVLTLLGNITMVTVWYTPKTEQDWYDLPALVGVVWGSVVSAGFGLIEMVSEDEFLFTPFCDQEASNEQVPDP